MIQIGSKCFLSACEKPPRYYCCDPEQSTCRDCSKKTCEVCHKSRNKPIKSLQKNQQNNASCIRCFRCRQIVQKQSVSLLCSHHLCLKCICIEVCDMIKSNAWVKFVPKEERIVKCLCVSRCSVNVGSILKNYCFCCGESLEDKKVVDLKNGLLIKISCKNRFKYQSAFSEGVGNSSFLKKQQFEKVFCQEELPQNGDLLQQDKHQFVKKGCKVEEFTKQVNIQSNSKLSEKANEEESKPKAKIFPEEVKQQSVQIEKYQKKKKKYKPKKQEKSADKGVNQEKEKNFQTCIMCERRFSGNSYSNQFPMCKQCHNRTKFELQNFEKKKSQPLPERSMQRTSSNPKVEKKVKLHHSPNPKQQKHDKQLSDKKNKKKEYSDYQTCIGCGRRERLSVVNTVYVELGGFICEICQSNQKSQMNKVKNNPNENSYLRYLKKFQTEKLFGKNINCFSSFDITSGKVSQQRMIKPSIIQQFPDSVEVDPFIDISDEISCFRCGYFIRKEQLFESNVGSFCLSCYLVLSISKH